jgi:hypothetical protein
MYKAGKGVCVCVCVCVCVQVVVYAQICIYLYIAHTHDLACAPTLSRAQHLQVSPPCSLLLHSLAASSI